MTLWRKGASDSRPATEAEPASGDELDTVPGERGIPSVNRARSVQSRVSSVMAIGLMSVLGLGLLAWYYANAIHRQARARETAQTASKSRAQGEMLLPPLGRVEPPLPPVAQPPEPSALEQVLGPPPELPTEPPVPAIAARGYPPSYGAATEKTPGQLAFERRLSGPAFSILSDSAIGGVPANRISPGSDMNTSATWTNERANGPFPPEPAGGELGGMLTPSVTPAVTARVLPTQRLLLSKGAFIDCTLETAIDSTLPGMTTCITATDTFSVDGKVVLLERGTKLVGETRGQVQQGAARVFVLWTEARTPTGVVVPLASPGSDELGRSGLPGEVSRHFWERFGAAILISVIDGAVQAAVQPSGDGATVIYNPSASQDIMTEILKGTINIPPTVVKHHGDRIQVLVARDLDFRSVYELRAGQ